MILPIKPLLVSATRYSVFYGRLDVFWLGALWANTLIHPPLVVRGCADQISLPRFYRSRFAQAVSSHQFLRWVARRGGPYRRHSVRTIRGGVVVLRTAAFRVGSANIKREH